MIKAVKGRRPYNGALRKEQAQMTRSRVLDAARRLLTNGTYSSVTMEDIAGQAGVAYQTVYGIFGTKQRLAQGVIEVGFPHVADALKLFEPLRETADPEVWLRSGARVNRLIYELCADLLRFMRESGDPGLLSRYREREEQRLVGMTQGGLVTVLENSGRLRPGISATEAVAVIWSWSGPDHYTDLVFERGWATSRYEQWLGDSMINTLLQPEVG
ncbi:MAG: TetR/AcrR family transcriptional regulator [Candidatus Dormibacteraeota bacterium]|nr:TetR/AcrR family transcriptional regulator [Candidatus Dormibacteraeota bacterium]